MTLLALLAIICFGFATYNLTCAFVDIPTKKTSQMMMMARKQQGIKAEKLLDVYTTKIAGLLAPYLKLDKLKRNKLQRALDTDGIWIVAYFLVLVLALMCMPFINTALGER